jgi:hypothetical protein
MASNARKKTTMAKLDRERMLRTRREEKRARRDARRAARGLEGSSPEEEASSAEESIPLEPAQLGGPDRDSEPAPADADA